MTILPPSRRWGRRPVLDGYGFAKRRAKHLVIAVAIEKGLLFALITHAVLTVLFSPRRSKP